MTQRDTNRIVRPELADHNSGVVLPWTVSAYRPLTPFYDDRTDKEMRSHSVTATRRRALVTLAVPLFTSEADPAPRWVEHVLQLDEKQTKELADALASTITWWDESYPEEEEKANA